MTNPDSLQAICAELRELIVRVMRVERDHAVEVFCAADGQSSPKTRAEFRAAWDALYAGFNRLERLDAEMRKEVDELRNERDDYRASLYDETDGITGTLRKDELAELRARLAACERLPEQWHDRAKTIHDRLEQSAVIECADELDAALTPTAHPDVPGVAP